MPRPEQKCVLVIGNQVIRISRKQLNFMVNMAHMTHSQMGIDAWPPHKGFTKAFYDGVVNVINDIEYRSRDDE